MVRYTRSLMRVYQVGARYYRALTTVSRITLFQSEDFEYEMVAEVIAL